MSFMVGFAYYVIQRNDITNDNIFHKSFNQSWVQVKIRDIKIKSGISTFEWEGGGVDETMRKGEIAQEAFQNSRDEPDIRYSFK